MLRITHIIHTIFLYMFMHILYIMMYIFTLTHTHTHICIFIFYRQSDRAGPWVKKRTWYSKEKYKFLNDFTESTINYDQWTQTVNQIIILFMNKRKGSNVPSLKLINPMSSLKCKPTEITVYLGKCRESSNQVFCGRGTKSSLACERRDVEGHSYHSIWNASMWKETHVL